MKKGIMNVTLGIFCLGITYAKAQVADTNYHNYGIWQSYGIPLSSSEYPELRGRLCNFNWMDLQTAPSVWNWAAFDKELKDRVNDSLPIIFMVYTEDDAPAWLYSNGVSKVNEKDSLGNIISSCPYYADPEYKFYFRNMIAAVHAHVEALPAYVRKRVIAVQGCFGSTGDFISYKGRVDAQYTLDSADFYSLFKEFTQYYYDEYKNTSPKIYLLSNPKNQGKDQCLWLMQNCPGGWIKTGTLGKGFQLNNEVAKAGWLYKIINKPQNGDYVRTRSEITGGATASGWWLKSPYRNMFTLMCYGVFWGLDWSNQGNHEVQDPLYDSAFRFFNKYAGVKEPAKSKYALCALHDGLDAADTVRFPTSIYGAATNSSTRFKNIVAPYVAYGAKLEDVASALDDEMTNLNAKGINDVGWNIFAENYERNLHQISPNATSAGYWNVTSADPDAMYGRFARGFDIAKGKNALYFDVDSTFLSNAPLNSAYPVMIDIAYLDNGTGSWQLLYDAAADVNKTSIVVKCTNSMQWKHTIVTISDAYFGNRSINNADFYIKNTGSKNVIFSYVELSRPNMDMSDIGLFTASNTYGSSSAQVRALNVTPEKPGTITGPTSVAAAQTGLIYQVPATAGLTYTWSVPGKAKIISGQNTSTIKVTWGSVTGNVTVKAINDYSASASSILKASLSASPVSDAGLAMMAISIDEKELVIFPNPVRNIATIRFTATTTYTYTLEITDIAGKRILRQQGKTARGMNFVNADVHEFVHGIYIVNIFDENGNRRSIKMVKL